MRFSEHIDNIKPSETFKFFALIKEKQKNGIEVTPLVAGELDEETPVHIADAAIKAIQSGKTKYTINSGILELRESICKKLKAENDLSFKPENVLISNGGKHALFNCLYSLCGHNDEVLIFAPYYSSYPDMIKLTGATPIIVNTIKTDYIPTAESIKSAITNKTKAIIINSPCNPTGIVYDKSTLEMIADIVHENSLWLLSDEIYEKILFDDAQHFSPVSISPELYNKTIILNSVSKTYAMTGWRIGYAVGPAELIAKAALVQSQTTSNASSISQYASLAAINSDDSFIDSVIPKLLTKRDRAMKILSRMDNIEYIKPAGAFYLFLKVSSYYKKDKITNSTALAMYLLNNHNVGIVPGSAFGADDYIRISFAASLENVEKGCQQIVDGLNQLSS